MLRLGDGVNARTYSTATASLACLLLLGACQREDSALPSISLAVIEPAARDRPSAVAPVRIAIASTVSHQRTIRDYERMLRYIGQKLGRPVELVQRSGYAECVALLEKREVDAAFMCSGPYVDAHDRFGAEPLVVPEIGGLRTYRAYIIVGKDSPFQAFADLRGKSFAFTDPLSATGKVFPEYLLERIRESPDTFFGRTVLTHTHDNSIEAVADGVVDGASVSSVVWESLARAGAAARTRVILRSPPMGMPPLVVHPRMDPALRDRLRGVLLGMHRDGEGRSLLQRAGIRRFVVEPDSSYNGLRGMMLSRRRR